MAEEKEKPEVGEEEPETPEEGTPKNATEEKTSEEIESLKAQIEALQAQKEHFREKAQRLGEELEELKTRTLLPPSEKELKESYPDWDMLSPIEQKNLQDILALKKEIATLKEEIAKASTRLAWEDEFTKIVKSFPQLQARKEEFKEFLGSDLPSEKLAKAFLFEEAKELGAKEEKEKASRPGLEKATGGVKVVPASGELTPEEAAELRKKNPQLYFKLIRERRLKIKE